LEKSLGKALLRAFENGFFGRKLETSAEQWLGITALQVASGIQVFSHWL
jgi:hypothetical protein